ncbi:ABC transporter ATP-binding protein/permease [Candidatus Pseudothioglobus singularis]|nr:ABC transporter ATP-binding protein/permease [Candidatus Pseudothioglobus singularis]
MRQYLYEMYFLLGSDKKKLPWLVFLFFLLSLLDIAGIGLIGPYVTLVVDPDIAKELINKHIAWFKVSSDTNLLLMFSIILILIFFAKTLFGIWINYVIVKFSLVQKLKLTENLMNSYQNMPYILYLKRNSSEYINTTISLVDVYATGIIQRGMKMLCDVIVGITILVLLAFTNLIALLILTSLLGTFIVAYDRLFRNKMKLFGKKSNIESIRTVKGIHEGLEGLKEIRVLGNEEYFFNEVREGVINTNRYSLYNQIIKLIPRYLIEFLLIMFIVVLVIVKLVSGGNLQSLLPTLAVFGFAAVRLLPTANIISTGITAFRFERDSVNRLFNDVKNIDHQLSEKNKSKNFHVNESFKKLELRNISFRYPNAKHNSLDNINMEIKSGESIGIIGESGSGKTTLIDTMLGLLDLKNGEMLFNDRAVKDDLNLWHKHIAYLPQQVFLIDNKLKMNVALGVNEDDIDDKLLQKSLKMASLSRLIDELPDGVETVLGERGVRLSGGQRQRIALARALYHKRDILVMDESTSALDNETEKEIVKEIKALKGKITMIVIAHRPSTIEHCDIIYKLHKGSIVDFGSPKKML